MMMLLGTIVVKLICNQRIKSAKAKLQKLYKRKVVANRILKQVSMNHVNMKTNRAQLKREKKGSIRATKDKYQEALEIAQNLKKLKDAREGLGEKDITRARRPI